jgi:CheY-like chemotaxis protein
MTRPTVLTIDDDTALHLAIGKALKQVDCDLLFAENGQKGLELMTEVKPTLIFLDLLMPVMDGFEFLQQIQPSPGDPYSVVVITGHGVDAEIKRCYQLGVDFFLKKPLSMVEVSCLARRCMVMKEMEQERMRLITELQLATDTIKDMSRIIPICASCKNIRRENGYWQAAESFFHAHMDMDFTHSLCPTCVKKLYPDLKIK